MLLAPVPRPRARSDTARATESGANDSARYSGLSTEAFGSSIPLKDVNSLRIGFQNISGFSTRNNTLKDDILLSGLKLWEFDVFGMAETNIDWRLASETEKLHFRTREWFETLHLSHSFNCTDLPIKKHQHGGTALFSINKSAHRVCEKGIDPTLLGRWC